MMKVDKDLCIGCGLYANLSTKLNEFLNNILKYMNTLHNNINIESKYI